MNNDNYVILTNTRHSEPIMAAHDLDDQVSSLKQAVIRLIEIYDEVERGGDRSAMLRDHESVISAARSLVADNI